MDEIKEVLETIIVTYRAATIIVKGAIAVKDFTKKFYSQKKKNTRRLKMKKVKVNEKNQPIVSKGRGSRNPEKGYVRTHGFSCHDEYWLEITEEAYSRNLSVGQYLTLAHKFYMKANERERVFDTKKAE